jgi:class 3 adenylate cyclase/tetratricopeptide (TPR) repeat protein
MIANLPSTARPDKNHALPSSSAPSDTVVGVRTCPACATPNQDESKFCAECGARLPVTAVDNVQRKTVTILFADVTGSTTLGERMEPEVLRRMLARFFEAARSVVESHGGTVEKFIGDAVLAVFGVPVLHEDDALRALRSALDLMSALQRLNVGLEQDFGAGLQIRVGVNTGDVVTGTSDRLVTGDAVNVAARLEQLAPPGEIYVGELSVHLAGTLVTVEEIEPAFLKGKSVPTRVFRLVAALHGERPVGTTPMIGRRRQLEMLHGAFRQAVADRSCVLFTLLGSAGVGKSRLSAEFLDKLDATVLRARCLSYGSGVGLWPAVDLVQQLQGDRSTGAVATLLASDDAVAAAVRTLIDSEGGTSTSTEIAWAVRQLLEASARVQPLVVVLDDLHWAQDPLFEIVEHVVTLSRDAPILILVLARPELLERRANWGGGALNTSTVLLEPLRPEDTAALVDGLATTLDTAARHKVQAATGGNPLFVEEMVALMEASGGASVGIPPTIQALLAARLDQLDPDEQRALECGSVEGQSFHRRGLAALGLDDAATAVSLPGLVRKDLLRPDRPTVGRDEAYQFRHVLLRDAAYDRLPKSTRAVLHERFARWLDEQAPDISERDSLVGYHLEQSFRYLAELAPLDQAGRALGAEAGQRLDLAAGRQMIRSDLTGAIELHERARALAGPETHDVSKELGIATALRMCGRLSDAAMRADAAAEMAAQANDRIGAQQANLLRASFEMLLGTRTIAELRRQVETALREFEAADSDAALAWAWWAALLVAQSECRYGDGADAAANVKRYAERSADLFLTTQIDNFNISIVHGPIPVTQALEMLEQSPGINPSTDTKRAPLIAHLGRFDEARAMHERSVAGLLDRGMTLIAAGSGQDAWAIEMAAGDPKAAAAVSRETCTRLEELGDRGWLSTSAAQLAESLYALGRDDEAQHWVDRALELGEADDAVTQAQARMVRAMISARAGDSESALRDLLDVLSITATMQAPQFQGETALNAAHVFEMINNLTAATEQLRHALNLFTAKGSIVYAARAAAALATQTTAP